MIKATRSFGKGRNLSARIRAVIVVLAFLFVAPSKLGFAQGAASENAVKAAFLYKFAQFVEWPASAFASSGAPFVMGVLGSDSFAAQLETSMSGKTLDGHPVAVKRFSAGQPFDRVHLLFVPAGAMSHAADLGGLRGKPTLLVGDSETFARKYGHIGLVIEHNHMAFEINVNASKACGLTVSSRLLQLARVVDN